MGLVAATSLSIPYRNSGRRPGDVPRPESCPKRGDEVLGGTAQRSLTNMCLDGLAWQSAIPKAMDESWQRFAGPP